MFTSFYSLNDILNTHDMRKWFHVLFLEDHLNLFPREMSYYPLRLAEFRGKTPWGGSFSELANQVIDTANLVLELQKGERKCLHLRDWEEWEPREYADLKDPDNIFLITPRKELMSGPKKPALIICPGGGYECVSFQNEGTPVQRIAENNGYAAFMMRYRVAPSRYPDPQMDVLETIAYVREHAETYHVDPQKIGIVGFSAGGHLCGSCAGLWERLLPEGKPNAVVLGYPVVTLSGSAAHEESALALLGTNDRELRRELSLENLISPGYPPVFVWACKDDGTVPCENTMLLEQKLSYYNIDYECHYYPVGGHGCGLAYENSAWNWSIEMFSFLNRVL